MYSSIQDSSVLEVQGILNFRGTNLFVEGEWECEVFVVQPTDFSVGRQGFFFFFFFFFWWGISEENELLSQFLFVKKSCRNLVI